MNLLSLAELVCAKVGKVDDESLSVCKDFIRQRHEMAYDFALWKDTVSDDFEVTVDAGATHAVLPFECARPLAVWDKDGGLPIDVSSLVSVAIVAPSKLDDADGLVRFVEVESVGWPFDLGTGSKLSFLNAGNPEITVNISGWGLTSALPVLDHVASESVVCPAGGQVLSQWWGRVDRMTKPQTPSSILVGQTNEIPEPTWIWPAMSTEAVFARIRLVGAPTVQTTLRIIGKRVLRQMYLDTDAPMIRGVDNALLAFAQADMLERSRQYAKAQAKVTEGAALLAAARDAEKRQAAHEATIIPDVAEEEGLEEW